MEERIQAEELVREHITDAAAWAHAYATEAILGALAAHLGRHVLRWRLTGLLHDIDCDQTAQTPERHGAAGADMLNMLGFDEEITHAVLSHAHTGEPRASLLDKALYAADPAARLLLACAQAQPDGKMAGLTLAQVLRHDKDDAFSPQISRRQIGACQELGMTRRAFLRLALQAVQAEAAQIEGYGNPC
ncbi:MAG: HDIG domain-containing protein [Oscillospiraceae bacterium]|jgi:putative nucleotidyltransferase with HDIG domain|nr:HDIG domain-containing protein [Oscillospiraceae bacterium]